MDKTAKRYIDLFRQAKTATKPMTEQYILAVGVDNTEMFDSLKSECQEKFGITWVGLCRFNNTFAIAVREEAAQQYNLETTSDLAAKDCLNKNYFSTASGMGGSSHDT